MAAGSPAQPGNEPRAHLLPGFDEFLLGYKDRSAALPPRFAGRVVPGANGVFLPTLVLDSQVVGTWRRGTRARSVCLQALPFVRLAASGRKAFVEPLERFAQFLLQRLRPGSPEDASIVDDIHAELKSLGLRFGADIHL